VKLNRNTQCMPLSGIAYVCWGLLKGRRQEKELEETKRNPEVGKATKGKKRWMQEGPGDTKGPGPVTQKGLK